MIFTYVKTDCIQIHFVEFDFGMQFSHISTTFEEKTVRHTPKIKNWEMHFVYCGTNDSSVKIILTFYYVDIRT